MSDISDELPRSEFYKFVFLKRIPQEYYEYLPICGIGIAESFNIIMAFHNNIYFGTRFLSSAAVPMNDFDKQLIERYKYLQAAILAFNSSTDYIYQTIFFYFELYRKFFKRIIVSRDDIIQLSEKVKGPLLDKMDSWLQKDDRTAKFYPYLVQYKKDMEGLKSKANETSRKISN